MLATIEPVVRALNDHVAWWGPALGVPIIGVFVPNTPVIIGLGAEIASGALAPQTILWAFGGAVLGNAVVYEVGRTFPTRAWRPSNARLRNAYDKASGLIARGGTVAILLSRLITGVVGVVSFAAGLARTPRSTFYSACLVANLLWVAVMATLGYASATGWQHLGPHR